MTHTKKQESMVHTKGKNLSVETDSEWAQTLILADKGFKATVLGVFLFCFVWKKEMEILIWANLKIITQETNSQKLWESLLKAQGTILYSFETKDHASEFTKDIGKLLQTEQ